jgi:excisionase family DNA binding protein
MSQQPDEWLSVEEIASTLKMDEETVRRWIRTKKLKGYRFGRDLRVRRGDFDNFVKDRAIDDNNK